MYAGYYLKINGTTFPQKYVAKGTYKGKSEPKLIETWEDSLGDKHPVYSDKLKAEITFSIVEHDSDEHATIVQFFQTKTGNAVEYFDDKTNEYRTATSCKIEDISWDRRSSYGGKIQYSAVKVKITEN